MLSLFQIIERYLISSVIVGFLSSLLLFLEITFTKPFGFNIRFFLKRLLSSKGFKKIMFATIITIAFTMSNYTLLDVMGLTK